VTDPPAGWEEADTPGQHLDRGAILLNEVRRRPPGSAEFGRQLDQNGRPQRTIAIPDPGPNVEILFFYYPITHELLLNDSADRALLADVVAEQVAHRAHEAILGWQPPDSKECQ
jgi:hypothetical protein